MSPQSKHSWFRNVVEGRRTHRRSGGLRCKGRARLAVERFEERDCPSNSIPLNFFNTTPDWTAIGPAPILNGSTPGGLSTTGRVSGIAVDPSDPDRIFVTGASGGVWRTLDGGANWTPLTLHIPGIPDNMRTLNMGAIAIAPSNPNIIYAAEGEADGDSSVGFGVLKSTDGGDTWTLTGSSVLAPLSAHSIVVDSLNPNIAFVNAVSYVGYGLPDTRTGGVFRTVDGGTTWTNITASSTVFAGATAFTDVDLQPRTNAAEPVVLYTTLGFPGGDLFNGVYRTINALAAMPTWNLLIGGSTLVPGTGPGNIQMSLSRQFPSTIFASIADNNQAFLGVYKTTDSGVNWQRVLAPPPNIFNGQGNYDNVITVSPINPNEAIVAGATGTPLITRDGGLTWQNISNVSNTGPHADHHAGVFDSDNNYLAGTDGGIFRFNDDASPKLWESLNGFNSSNPTITALNIVQQTSIALHPRNANLALDGSQDNGTHLFNDNVGWNQVNGGDAGKVVYDYDNPLHAVQVHPIASFGAQNFVQFTNDGGLTWSPSTTQPPGANQQNTLFYPPMIIDPSRSQRYFFGSDKLAISEDGGVTWGDQYRFPQGNQTIPPDPLSNVPPPFGPIPITAIGVGRASGGFGLIYVAHFNVLLQLVFGPPPNPAPTMMDWADISPTGAADVGSITEIVVDPQNPANIYVVGGGGVARSQDFGATWTKLNGTGPNALPSFFAGASIQLDPRNFNDPTDDTLYVGGSYGVYKLNNPGGMTFNWSRVGGTYDPVTHRGMPDVDVTQLVLNTTTGILAAATYGAGTWEIQVRGLIRGQKFEDLNGNGMRDTGEPGVPNVFIRLLNNDNPSTPFEIATTQTDANGFFEFRSLTSSQLTAVNYLLVEVNPPGTVQSTTPLAFQNLTEQSTFDISDPSVGWDPTRVEIGNFRFASISGVKFEDRNNNGVRDTGEPGLAGFQIFLDANNNGMLDWTDANNNGVWDAGEGEQWTVTNASGAYTLANLGPGILNGEINPATFNGAYLVREVQQTGFVQTSDNPAPIVLASTQNLTGVNIGNIRIGRITGSKFQDVNGNGIRDMGEGPLAGFTFDLIDTSTGTVFRTVQSDPNGNVQFLSLPAGTYRVRERSQTGFTQTTADPADFTLTSTTQLDNAFDFGNFRNMTFTGSKFNDLDGDGVQEAGEPALQGFTFQLLNAATGEVLASTTSNAQGNFTFGNRGPLPNGAQYRIREVPPAGWIQTTANPADLPIVSGQNASVLFGNFLTVTISGTVFNDLNSDGVRQFNEPGLANFTLELRKDGVLVGTTTTDSGGAYAFPSTGPGSYLLTLKPHRGFVTTAPAAGYAFDTVSGAEVTGQDFGENRRQITVTSNDAGGAPLVVVRDATTNSTKMQFNAYDVRFGGGVRVAVGYVNNDTIPDIITAAGAGGGPHVRVFDGASGQELFGFMAYEIAFTGGVYVAAGDVNGDGFDDIITGTGVGGGPLVKVFSGANGQLLRSFYAYSPIFRGGVTVAAGDYNGDGLADIATGAGPGGGPHVEVFNGANQNLLFSVFPYATNFSGGVFVALGDLNGDGRTDLITGPGIGGGPHVTAYNAVTNSLMYSFLAYPNLSPGFPWSSGAHVAAYDVNLDGRADFIISPGRGQQPRVRILNGTSLAPLYDFMSTDPSFLGGVYVGGA